MFAGNTGGIPATGPSLMVFVDRVGGRAEPVGERCHQGLPSRGVALDDLEFFRGELVRLVQDLERNIQLADVVQQCRPPQMVELVGLDLHLLADHHGVGPDPFGVASREAIVTRQPSRQFEQGFSCLERRIAQPLRFERCELLLQLPSGHAAQGQPEPGRRLIWEDERQ